LLGLMVIGSAVAGSAVYLLYAGGNESGYAEEASRPPTERLESL